MKKILFLIVLWNLGISLSAKSAPDLASWHEGEAKQSIRQFVERISTKDSPDFIPPEKRIATFDNDGTLWAEQPMYFQLLFAVDRIRELAPQHPEWENQEPFASLLKGDVETALAGGHRHILELIMTSHTGMTTEEFEKIVTTWISQARHPQTQRLYTEMVYQAMLEMLTYLRKNGFKTFIVSGGGIEFMRPWTERVYGLPPEQVIGSSIKTRVESRNGEPVLVRLPELNFFDDKEGKIIAIHQQIGSRPLIAFGNSDGDLPMLQWTAAKGGLAVYIHHSDAQREWAYDRQSPIGRLDKGLDEAQEKGWVLVDMKRDWKKIFPFEAEDSLR